MIPEKFKTRERRYIRKIIFLDPQTIQFTIDDNNGNLSITEIRGTPLESFDEQKTMGNETDLP